MRIANGALARHTASLSLALACTLAPAEAQKEASAPRTTGATPARFAWPVPGRVAVTETVLKKGKTGKMRYTIELSKATLGNLRVSLRDFEFVEFGGMDVTKPDKRKALAPLLAMMMAFPDLVVSPEGDLVRTIGEDMTERVLQFLAKERGADDPGIAAARRMLADPTVKQAMNATVADFWNVWVGAWTDWDLEAGKTRTDDVKLPLGQAALPAKLVATHHGPATGNPGHVRLTMETTAEGAEATRAFLAGMRKMTEAAGGAPIPDDAIAAMKMVNRIEVVTDPATLRPLRAKMAKDVSIQAKGEAAPRRQIERREYAFDWSAKSSSPGR